MPADLRKVALMAGVMMMVATLWSLVYQLVRVPMYSLVAISALDLLVAAPLPVFLLLLYRDSTGLAISTRQRYLASALVAIRCAALAVSAVGDWHQGIHPGPASAGQWHPSAFWGWISQWPVIAAGTDAVEISSMLAFILFLVVLSLQRPATPQEAGVRHSYAVERAALIAVCVCGLELIMGLAFALQMYSTQRIGVPHQYAFNILRSEFFGLPRLIAPWIVYVSLRRSRPPINPEEVAAPVLNAA